MNNQEKISQFLAGAPHAVVGASRDRLKIGYRVLQAYRQNGRQAYPVNPNAEEIGGLRAYPDLASLPESIYGVSVITPPRIAESLVEQTAALGIQNIWFQPGAESGAALLRARELGMNVIAGGPCILIILGYSEHSP